MSASTARKSLVQATEDGERRWFLGAWGVGTYRQDDSVDVRYEAPDGSPRVAPRLEIEAG